MPDGSFPLRAEEPPPAPVWRVFAPPGPEGFAGDTPAAQAAARADYLAHCLCVYCGDRLAPGDAWGFLHGAPAGRHVVRGHLVHRACYEQDR